MYTPDKWMLVRVSGTDPHWRIFATWGGGYTYGESWRLNSGVMEVKDEGDCFDFVGFSGSVYRCSKTGYGITAYGMGILKQLIENSGGKLDPIWEDPKNIMEMVW